MDDIFALEPSDYEIDQISIPLGISYWFTCPFCGAFIQQAKGRKDWLEGPITCPDEECGAELDYAEAEEVDHMPDDDRWTRYPEDR